MNVPAGWYPDPARPVFERWWDGTDWTEAFRPKSASKSFWTAAHPDEDAVTAVPPYPPPPIAYPTTDEFADDVVLFAAGGLTGHTVRSSLFRGLIIGMPLPSRRAIRRSVQKFNSPPASYRAATNPAPTPPPAKPAGADNKDTGEPEVTPAGWYPDPTRPLFERWWDGTGWTEQTRPKSANRSFWDAN